MSTKLLGLVCLSASLFIWAYYTVWIVLVNKIVLNHNDLIFTTFIFLYYRSFGSLYSYIHVYMYIYLYTELYKTDTTTLTTTIIQHAFPLKHLFSIQPLFPGLEPLFPPHEWSIKFPLILLIVGITALSLFISITLIRKKKKT